MKKAELLSTLERMPDDDSQFCVGFLSNGEPVFAEVDAILALPYADGHGIVLLMTQEMADAVLVEEFDNNGNLLSVGFKHCGKIVPGQIAISDYAKKAIEEAKRRPEDATNSD